ncbi:unnamed protein product, partial [Meganyctiphanes norvegica]
PNSYIHWMKIEYRSSTVNSVMANLNLFLVFGALLPSFAVADCTSTIFLPYGVCAQIYRDTNCKTDHRNVLVGEYVAEAPRGWNDVISSVVVRDGCRFIGWENYHRHGEEHETYINRLNLDEDGMNDRISSYECTCTNYP